MVERDELVRHLDEKLEVARFRDYCPNGLQVEGRARIGRIVAGVSASQALIEAAIERGADALLVHHGWFWKNEDGRVTGLRRRRLGSLMAHDINLLAYHLPLDTHPELGNNAQLARHLGWIPEARFGDQDLAWQGRLATPMSAGALAAQMGRVLGRTPLMIGDEIRPIARIGWCTGGAQGFFEHAIAQGLDAYVSGEISEQTVHLARESGVAYFAAGHHATERYGPQALAAYVAERFAVPCEFVDIDNPV